MTSSDTYQLKWHAHSTHLNGSVAALLRSERFTDVVLCTMDGSQIPAHKFILSSCSVYLSTLFDGQRAVMRTATPMLYVVLPSEISTKALKILVEYMYKGETTVSNEVLDTVLKAGEVLKIRGLWQQTHNDHNDTDKNETQTAPASVNKQPLVKKPEEILPKLAMKKDDNKLIKVNQVVAGTGGVTRPMFIGPPKLVFIKTPEGTTQAAIRPGTPMGSKSQTILVAPAPTNTNASSVASVSTSTSTMPVTTTMVVDDSPDEGPPQRVLRRHVVEKKYGKKQKTDTSVEDKAKEAAAKVDTDKKKSKEPVSYKPANSKEAKDTTTEIQIKDEPDWDNSSIEEEERSIAEMLQAEMNVKAEPVDDMDIEEDSLIYSPLACELCAEVFTVPGAWVRHVEGHAIDTPHARKRKSRSASDDTEETMALLRCDLCQKHFPNPGEWVRHIQSTHTETEKSKESVSYKPANSKEAKNTTTEIQIKYEPDCDNSSIEEEERSIAEMLQAEINVKAEPVDDMDIKEDSLVEGARVVRRT